MKTLGHRSKNKQEQMSKRAFVPRQGRSSLGGTNSVAAGGPQIMGSGAATGSQQVMNSGGAGGSQQILSLGGAGG